MRKIGASLLYTIAAAVFTLSLVAKTVGVFFDQVAELLEGASEFASDQADELLDPSPQCDRHGLRFVDGCATCISSAHRRQVPEGGVVPAPSLVDRPGLRIREVESEVRR